FSCLPPLSASLHLLPLPTRRSSDLSVCVVRLSLSCIFERGACPQPLAVAALRISPPDRTCSGETRCRRTRCRLSTYRTHCRLRQDRKSTRLNSSHQIISYAVFCLKQ